MALLFCYTSQWHGCIENTGFRMPTNATKPKCSYRSEMGMIRTSKITLILTERLKT